MERLFDTYDVVTFTDGTSELEKNRMPSYVTAAGIYWFSFLVAFGFFIYLGVAIYKWRYDIAHEKKHS